MERCDLRIAPTGSSAGSCLLPNGTVVDAEPGQFRVNGAAGYLLGWLQAGKSGIIGRVFVNDGERVFGGSFVAVSAGNGNSALLREA